MISTLGSRASKTTKTWLLIANSLGLFFYRHQAEFQITHFNSILKNPRGQPLVLGLNLLHPTAYLAPIYTSHFYDEDTLLYVLTCFCRFALALYWKGCAQAREFGFLASALFWIPTLNLGLFSSWKPIVLEWFAIPVPDFACNTKEREIESCQKHYNLTNYSRSLSCGFLCIKYICTCLFFHT